VTSTRLEDVGSLIDRGQPLSFTFDGVGYEGFAGDTLASALLANGVIGGFRSPILGRPRGVFSAGAEEPNAFVEVSEPWFETIVPATAVELVDLLVATSRPGVGRLPTDPALVPVPAAEHRHTHVELLVIGSGHDVISPAEEAARRGERVLVVEREPRLAGVGMAREPAKDAGGIRVMTRATALGLYDEGYAVVRERAGPVDRIWHIRARRVVLATGGFERPIAFADNDRPGVMLAGAAARYLSDFGIRVGERPVVFTARSPAYAVAAAFAETGAAVGAIVDVRASASPTDPPDVERLAGWTVTGTDGDERIEAVHVASPSGERRTIACDALLISGGWNPNLTLWRSIGGRVRYDESTACFVPTGEGPSWLSIVGSAAGDVFADSPYWFVPGRDTSRHFVDLQRDQTVADIADALGSGLRSVEHVKRATHIGTAADQGRTSGVLTAAIVNAMLGENAGAQGPSNARPPETPVPYATLAGRFRGELFDPVRTTPIHAWHLEHGAVFEDVGQWKRPRFFPGPDESMDEAVERECLAVRNAVGAMDASTLGKIEVVGPDAPAFLDRNYTNRMSNLAVGSIRYGLMLGLDGMVLDDGVAMRLAEDRYLVTTTTGNAAVVLDRFEEWLQTEWPELRVYCTSVTEQWAVVAINGPRARDVVDAVGTDVDLSRGAFPFMTFRDGQVAGVPARIARVSFSGELAYELHVAGWHGPLVWDAVLASGRAFGIEPYGTEAMHVLRAEKGYVIVGQDTDGSVTPADLGMDWIVNLSKGDFIGKRSLRRADLVRPDRKQLVGLFPHEVLPEGAQLVQDEAAEIPMALAGHVTSSYRSPALGRPFALAMLEGGHGMHGRTVFAPMRDRTVACTVTSPVPYDPEGGRRDG
jgi:sarcosine oxidase, subunit alpha